MKSKPLNLVGFIICLSSFIFWVEVNEFFNNLSLCYAPDSGQYILCNLGIILGLYRVEGVTAKMFVTLFSFRLFDELTFYNGVVDHTDILEIFYIFVLIYINYKQWN